MPLLVDLQARYDDVEQHDDEDDEGAAGAASSFRLGGGDRTGACGLLVVLARSLCKFLLSERIFIRWRKRIRVAEALVLGATSAAWPRGAVPGGEFNF